MKERFTALTAWLTNALGTPWALVGSVVIVLVWACTGPLFGFSDTWQLLINTSTTVITFWMVFVIQASQNRSDKAVHLKLDEILKWMEAQQPDEAIAAEERTEEEIDQLKEKVRDVAETSS